jgi:hypothetical protein
MLSAHRIHLARFRFPLAACTLLFVVSLAGCGSGEPFSYVPAKGNVTYEDGTVIPAAHLRLTFIAVNPPTSGDEKVFAPKGKADVSNGDGSNKDGHFDDVTSHVYGDGLLPGKHKVLINPIDASERQLEGVVPPEYRDAAKTPVEVDTAVQPMVIKVKKPAGGVKPQPSGGPGRGSARPPM